MATSAIHSNLREIQPRLWRFCLSLALQRAAAEDLLQSTCLRILEKHHQFKAGTRFDHWSFRIAKNLWFNELRSQRVRQGQGFGTDSVDDLVASNSDNPEWMVLRAEVFTEVMKLPEAQRLAIILVYVEGASYAEAADVMDVPLGTMMSRLAAARKQLAKLNGIKADRAIHETDMAHSGAIQ